MKEIELKFVTSAEHLEENKALLAGVLGIECWTKKILVNTYFDTPENALNQHRIALRIREVDNKYIQTLKTKGHSVAGLHQRGEWEWQVPENTLQADLLASEAWPASIDVEQLRPVFETNFERSLAIIQEGDSEIEIALDQGFILAGVNKQPLTEIELELKSGRSSDLFLLAQKVATIVPVILSDVSKAEQGYRLSGQLFVCPERRPYDTVSEKTSQFIKNVMVVHTGYWLASIDYFVASGELQCLRKGIQSLAMLGQLIEAAGIGDAMLSGQIADEVERLYRIASMQAHKKLNAADRQVLLLEDTSPGLIGVAIGAYLLGE